MAELPEPRPMIIGQVLSESAHYQRVEVEGNISGVRGICGLYVNGAPVGNQINPAPSRKVSKVEAGYIEQGPTHCGNCDEMFRRAVYMTSPCKKVAGMVDGRACCNLWEKVG